MIQFNNTTTKVGLIQNIEDCLGFNDGDISDNATLLAKFTGKINQAQLEVFSIALKTVGWNVDDLNQIHDPFISINLVSGQRDYHFTIDEDSALILGIYKVMVANPTGTFNEIKPVDIQSNAPSTMWDGANSTGTPTEYDKTGNGIFLNLIPNYDYSNGLKVFIDREPTYFTTSDTTKYSGIDGLCHDYLYLKPSYEWARDRGLQNVERLYRDFLTATQKIKDRYGNKEKDIKRRLTPVYENNR